MKDIKVIFNDYWLSIMKKQEYVEKLSSGELPYIDGFSKIQKIIDFYNKAFKEKYWGEIFENEFTKGKEYEIHQLLLSIVTPIIIIRNAVLSEMNSYDRNYKYFKNKIEKLETKLKSLLEKDNKKNDELAETNRLHDMSTGIFSHEEATSRSLFNKIINPYRSKETKKVQVQINDLYDQFFAYYYVKFEFISSLGLKIYKNNKKMNYWKDKLDAVNKFPIGKKIKESEVQIIIDVANHYKHQTNISKFPDIVFMNKLIKEISNKILNNTNFELYWNNVDQLYWEIEGVLNPLDLTGIE